MEQPSVGREVATVVAQTTLSWFVLFLSEIIAFSVYPLYYEGGLQSIGLLTGPVILNGIVLTLGLPLRVFGPPRRFLKRHGEVGTGVALVGLLLIVIGFAGGGMEYVPDEFGDAVLVYQELFVPVAVGYFLVALGLVHAWPPFGWLWGDDAQVARKVARGRALQGNSQP